MDDDEKLNNPVDKTPDNPVDPDNKGNDWTPPEGFDAEMFDENHALKPDSVKAKFDAHAAEKANLEKQVADMRKKVSNKDALATAEEYSKGYKNEEFTKFAEGEDEKAAFLKETLGNVDKIAKENGLSFAQANAVKEGLFGLMKDLGVVDTRTAEEAAAAQLELQKGILGDDAEKIVKENTDWVKNYGLFSDKEKEMLVLAAEQGNPLINSVLHKFKALFGKSSSADIPPSNIANNDGLPTDTVLAQEYVNPNTSDARKMEILQQRAAAGRTGKLPISAI